MVIVLLSYIITLMVVLGSNEGTSASTGLQDWHIGIIVLAIIVVLVPFYMVLYLLMEIKETKKHMSE